MKSPKRDGQQTVVRDSEYVPEVDIDVQQDTDGLYGSGSFFWNEEKQCYEDYAI